MTKRKQDREAAVKMKPTTSYEAEVRRHGAGWWVQVPEANVYVQPVRRLDRVAEIAQVAVAVALNVPPGEVAIVVRPVLCDEMQRAVWDVVQTRNRLAAATDGYRQALEVGVAALRRRELTVRDVGWLLGVTPQRVQQLTAQQPAPAQPAQRRKRTAPAS